MKIFKFISFVWLLITLFSCGESPKESIIVSVDQYHASVEKSIDIMVHDIFSPPVASRVFVYPNIAAYEILAQNSTKLESLSGKLTDLTSIPIVDSTKHVNLELAAIMAHMEISKGLIFSEDQFLELQDSLYGTWEKTNAKEFKVSKDYATEVVAHIKAWMDKDNYNQTRTMSKFMVDIDDPSRWQPTPPSYMDGIEPHWNKIRPFVLDSAQQFRPETHPKFSLNKGSKFYDELLEVYDVSKEITKKGDSTEEIEIAQFWDCNPFVSVTRGHFMFATKKISPGAHWILIAKIASETAHADFEETVNAYTMTSIAIADAFISCWDEKFRSNLIRPETLINQHIDPDWLPILQTPPFPEYTSGHSVASGAASVVLTEIFGDNFSFNDTSEIPYGLPARNFNSFYEASSEAAISRLYGGIHYRAAIEVGLDQGKKVGHLVAERLNL